jgi:glycosyltransferase involved in cell wall biosynthesis
VKKYKIAINTSPLSDDNSVRGVGYYTKNLVSSINSELKINKDFNDFQIDFISKKDISLSQYDLVHYPYFDPFKLTLPKTHKKFLVTVHDLIPIEYQQNFPVGIKGTIKWWIQKYRLKSATAIIVPTHHVKYAVSKILNFPKEKIFVTYEAADASFKPRKDKKELDSIQKKYSLPQKFILYVGDINWNKNIKTLVNACLRLKFPLVIVGKAAINQVPVHPWTKDIHWLQAIDSPLIIKTGFVPDEDLPLIFNLATIYCQPSFAEGFGLPLLQAMQSGTPTCFANTTSLPEISYHSGLSFNPNDIEDCCHKLNLLWQNPNLRHEYQQTGLERSQYFDWKKTAIETLTLYRLAINYAKN